MIVFYNPIHLFVKNVSLHCDLYPPWEGKGRSSQQESTCKSLYVSKDFPPYLDIIRASRPDLLSDLNPHTHYPRGWAGWGSRFSGL